MKNQDTFSSYHPIVNFLWFALVIGGAMIFMHPVCLLISFVASILYLTHLCGKNAFLKKLKYLLPLILLAAILNPALNHQGKIILTYLPTGNPLTLESIIYGFAAGIMLVSVLMWFECYTAIMTSDKFVYLFGKIIPSLSLVLSMTLRFVPKFKTQLDSVKQAQSGFGRDTSNGGFIKRLKSSITCLSIMITWSLENAIETADSMKSRGYGLKGRTAYSIYTFCERDKEALIFIIFCGLFIISGSLSGNLFWRYFPSIRGVLTEFFTVFLQIIYALQCFMPLIIDLNEEKQWKLLKSKI